MKRLFWALEDLNWNLKCRYYFWLHGPYGLAKVVEKIPFRFLIKYLKKYGATIGDNCKFERGLNIHRPFANKPFENLIIGNNVYLGHNTLIDLSRKVILEDNVIIASNCQLWTHASYYEIDSVETFKYGEKYGELKIENAAIIYSGVVITHGVRIGKLSIIGANSLLNQSIKENQFWGGVPAKFIKTGNHNTC
jgi:acetyltransferase-like isoleucine patch superfamily enzyme